MKRGSKLLNNLIKKITEFKRLPIREDNDFKLVENSISKGMRKYNYLLDEYGDPYFEKEYVRLLLMKGNTYHAFAVACCEGKNSAPKYPVLFARYYEEKEQYKQAAYFYMIQAKLSWSNQSAQLFKKMSSENYELWLKKINKKSP